MRIVVVDKDKCQPSKCGLECLKYCPVAKAGKEIIKIENFAKINEETKKYKGLEVPVKIIVNKKTKNFRIEVGTPSTSALLKKEAGIEVAKPSEKNEVLGNLTLKQIIKIAKLKFGDTELEKAVKQVLGTAQSIQGLRVENKMPKEIIKEINEGKIKLKDLI